MTDHADLIARARAQFEGRGGASAALGREVADALTNSVPRESYRQLHDQHEATRGWREKAERERDEARAQRDALAHVIEQAPHAEDCMIGWTPRCSCWKRNAPPVSLARHNAEIKAQAVLDLAASYESAASIGCDLVTRFAASLAATYLAEVAAVPEHAVDNASRPDDPTDDAGHEHLAEPGSEPCS